MHPLLTQLLNLPGMEVEDYHDRSEYLVLEVEAYSASAMCPRCQQSSSQLHQNHWHQVRDLSISDRVVWLNLNRRQFKCQPCGKPFSEEFEFVGKRRPYTNRFAEMIVQQVRHSNMHSVGVNHGLSDEAVWSMVEYVSKKNASGCEQPAATRHG